MRRINYIKLGVGLMIALVTGFYFCSKQVKTIPPASDDQPTSFLTGSKWKVVQIERGDTYHLEDFNGYQFTFNSNAMVDGAHTTDVFHGTWSMSTNAQKQRQLYIGFKDIFPVSGFNNKWTVMELSANRLRLHYAANDPVGPSDPSSETGPPSTERPYLMKLYLEAIPVNNPN